MKTLIFLVFVLSVFLYCNEPERLECVPKDLRCTNNTIEVCNYGGSGWQYEHECDENTTCKIMVDSNGDRAAWCD